MGILMEFTEEQLELAESLLDQMLESEVDYREWDKEDILNARNVCAENGLELTPHEMKEIVGLLKYIQEKFDEEY